MWGGGKKSRSEERELHADAPSLPPSTALMTFLHTYTRMHEANKRASQTHTRTHRPKNEGDLQQLGVSADRQDLCPWLQGAKMDRQRGSHRAPVFLIVPTELAYLGWRGLMESKLAR
ncbi:hypothetical protein AMECASPLE_017363 [Ameca splendens]|uniref:Uncharacterized protein n=1 Tax=Ameca splendens TaxID=208324 RepID=A0ABV0Z0R8_9TELE